jgi:hypothetical protein
MHLALFVVLHYSMSPLKKAFQHQNSAKPPRGAGFATVPDLARRNPENLYQQLMEVNEQRKLVRKVPALSQVNGWIEQAKELPRVVTY